jgi:hypothetical protein
VIVAGVVVAAVAAFVVSSVYYTALTPLERQVLGDAALDRGGRPPAWKVLTELLRTAIVASVFAWTASRARLQSIPGSLALAVVLWAGFPVVLLTGSIVWERVAPITAAIHVGDWLLKLLLLAVIIGLLH